MDTCIKVMDIQGTAKFGYHNQRKDDLMNAFWLFEALHHLKKSNISKFAQCYHFMQYEIQGLKSSSSCLVASPSRCPISMRSALLRATLACCSEIPRLIGLVYPIGYVSIAFALEDLQRHQLTRLAPLPHIWKYYDTQLESKFQSTSDASLSTVLSRL